MPKQDQIRILPQSVESERALLGACILRPEIIPKVSEMLSPLDFYRDAHCIIFNALTDLRTQAEASSLAEKLRASGSLEKAGGESYIFDLAEAVSTSAGWKYHAEIIKNRYQRRAMIRACSVAMDQSCDLTADHSETISQHKADIREIEAEEFSDYESNLKLCKNILADIERREETHDPYTGIKLGFKNIDEKMWGLEAGTTLYLIARPSMGKTALALNFAEYVSRNYPGFVLFFSLESNATYLMRRLVSAFSDVYLTRIRKAEIEEQQWPQLMTAFNDLSTNKLLRIISNPRYKQVEKLCAKIESMALEKRISLIIIDHIQRMSTGVRKNNRHLELSYVSELLTSTAQTVKSPMIILSQIRRRPEGEKDRKPELTDLKESGDLEQNADAVVSIYRKDRESEFAEIACLKGRDTGTWNTALRFNRFTQRFYDTDQTNPDDVYSPPIVDDWRER